MKKDGEIPARPFGAIFEPYRHHVRTPDYREHAIYPHKETILLFSAQTHKNVISNQQVTKHDRLWTEKSLVLEVSIDVVVWHGRNLPSKSDSSDDPRSMRLFCDI